MHVSTKTGSSPNEKPTPRQGQKRGPGPGRPTKLQVVERNRELLDNALDIFLAKGFEAATIRDITESVGMAKRTVTARYGNKISLFKAALKSAIDDWAAPEQRLRAAETTKLDLTLLAIARILVANYVSPTGLRLTRVINTEAYRLPEISAYMYEQCTRPLIAYLAELLRRNTSGDFPEAEEFALSYLNLVGTPARTVFWGIKLSEAEIDARIKHAVQLFLHGMLHRGAAVLG